MPPKPSAAKLRTQSLAAEAPPEPSADPVAADEDRSPTVTPAPPAASQPADQVGHDLVPREVTTPAAAPSRPAAEIVEISLPLGPLEDKAYIPEHLEVRLYQDRESGAALKRLLAGLVQYGVRLPATHRHPHGKAVSTYADAIRWLLREIAEKSGESRVEGREQKAA